MRARTAPALVAVLGLAAVGYVAVSAPPTAMPTTTTKMAEKSVVKSFPVVDARGRRVSSAKWRLTKAGGNCCEVLVMATRSGRLVEFGGTYPIFSDDAGATWREVAPLSPSTSRLPNPGPRKIGGGEGTLVQSPDGDILGIGWDPYSGDRLQSFMYDVSDKAWYYHEAPLHEPFYDREWMAVAKGPFTINGTKVPWVSLVLSNFNRRVVLMSTDGLTYTAPTQRELDAIANAPVTGFLPTTKDPDLDYMQPHAETGLGTLAKGVLSFDDTRECTVQTLTSTGAWACFAMKNEVELTGPLFTDSRGWVHEVVHEAGEFTFRTTNNGGRRWHERTFVLPGDMAAGSWDVKVNGRLGIAAIASHARKDDGTYQDVVMVVDVRSPIPRLKKIYYVGAGNLASTEGLEVEQLVTGASTRVDFTSVAILPNGQIAVSFADKTYDDPAVAILQANAAR